MAPTDERAGSVDGDGPARRAPPAAGGADAVRRAWDAGEPVLVVDPPATRAEADRIVGRVRPDEDVAPEVAAVAVTSGATGEPKGVELTWDGLAASAAAVSAALDADPTDRWPACLPPPLRGRPAFDLASCRVDGWSRHFGRSRRSPVTNGPYRATDRHGKCRLPLFSALCRPLRCGWGHDREHWP